MTVSAARTLFAHATVDVDMRWPAANAGESLDYSVDFTAAIADSSDSIVSVTWSASPADMVPSNVSVSGNVATCALIGGTPGRDYLVQIIVVTTTRAIRRTVGLFTELGRSQFPAPVSFAFGTSAQWVSGISPVPPPPGLAAVSGGLSATGTDQASATLLPAQTSVFTSVPAGTGARLRSDVGVGTVRVANLDPVNDLLVYPPVGGQIGSYGVNLPVAVSPNQSVAFSTASPATLWYVT